MNDLDDFNRLVGYWRAHGLSESEAYAKAESEMENYYASCDLQPVQQRRPAGSLD